MPEEANEDSTTETVCLEQASTSLTSATASVLTPQSMQNMKVENWKSRNRLMNKKFKFLPASPVSPNAPAEHTPPTAAPFSALVMLNHWRISEKSEASSWRATPSNIEVLACPPVEKKSSQVRCHWKIQQMMMLGIQLIFHWIEVKKQVLVHSFFFLAWSSFLFFICS